MRRSTSTRSTSAADTHLPRLLYSRDEAGYQLSISTRGIDYLIAAGRIHTRKIGGRILIPHDELLRFAGSDRKQVITPETQASQVASAA